MFCNANRGYIYNHGYGLTVPKGSIDEFTAGHTLPPCRYDSLTDIKIAILDSIAGPAQLCQILQASFSTKTKDNYLYCGSINFKILLNNESFTPPPCKSNTHKEKYAIIKLPLSKIPFKKFIISDGRNPLDYKLVKDTIEIPFNLSEHQRLEFYAENSLYKPIQLKIKGKSGVSVKTQEPLMNCSIEFTMIEEHKTFFSKTTMYEGLKFNKGETILFLSGTDNKSATIHLKELKKKNGSYILSKRKIRQLMH